MMAVGAGSELIRSFRDADLVAELLTRIRALKLQRRVRLMEVCGGHTAAIYRFALHDLLPEQIELLSGPGCPVCVTPTNFVDHAIALAQLPDVILTSFGDLIRVPGSRESLASARANGDNIRVVYSPAEALDVAEQNSSQRIVFLGIGFETTACVVASTMEQAIQRKLKNFYLLSALKTMPNALRALLSAPEVKIDGLILPGHVTTVTGMQSFEFIARDLEIPCVVSGFEPVDLLLSIFALCNQVASGQAEVQNGYGRVVKAEGNKCAQQAIKRVLNPVATEWRGLGMIPASGLDLKQEYSGLNALQFPVEVSNSREPRGCRCGDVLRGLLHPNQCPLMGRSCTPESPVGACMVSAEGACSAVFQYAYVDVESR